MALPTLCLKPDEELTADQIVKAAHGKLNVLSDGEKVGLLLPRKHREAFVTATRLGYLWDLSLSPWKISAGVFPFSRALGHTRRA